jgi:hypothetical protein
MCIHNDPVTIHASLSTTFMYINQVHIISTGHLTINIIGKLNIQLKITITTYLNRMTNMPPNLHFLVLHTIAIPKPLDKSE